MTELTAGRVYTATPCTLLVYYTERVTEQVDFRALFICGYTIDTTLTQLHHSYILLPEYFPRIPKWSLFLANNCRSVFGARLTAVGSLLALEPGS